MSNNQQNPVKFFSLKAFATLTGHSDFDINENEKNGKWSVLADGSTFFKCQRDIDDTKPMAWIVPISEDGELNIDGACLANVNRKSPLTRRFTLDINA